ncbi:hypothetical protein TGRUB_231998 [Toxoplasma gondii RUB]|uniref:Uncharacterized protein n=8 Tax=Toxoplasma gondii TaxID=5811 RepID=S7V3E4_TOXGG|nr:hypothetical protein TGGT1_231998 [Toxoplasma gondii GT1]KFG48628.1 hypothetical protein TGDOM2_231998 [Toxoplasma gondii GAB2-2007-GAL-DOM2]KFG51124.1 hypothetical protein TGP89_231998 [Toxoplasma gondii p89]KFG55346.1 hypothetical protein TGFOU_231998 [Toxoplasma gondii FOU]KFG63750.1 hypothetical protein TGRUB_231998 [Toxoplasma gondii RUB]KFH17373.1 hypothetical protein TGMAS_231998 [Toxoplasma gondii MAS]PUA92677.1 hypothetical protein TGBR9_231998 [Toxoplasma gondii TgCATBr9]RQX7582
MSGENLVPHYFFFQEERRIHKLESIRAVQRQRAAETASRPSINPTSARICRSRSYHGFTSSSIGSGRGHKDRLLESKHCFKEEQCQQAFVPCINK